MYQGLNSKAQHAGQMVMKSFRKKTLVNSVGKAVTRPREARYLALQAAQIVSRKRKDKKKQYRARVRARVKENTPATSDVNRVGTYAEGVEELRPKSLIKRLLERLSKRKNPSIEVLTSQGTR